MTTVLEQIARRRFAPKRPSELRAQHLPVRADHHLGYSVPHRHGPAGRPEIHPRWWPPTEGRYLNDAEPEALYEHAECDGSRGRP